MDHPLFVTFVLVVGLALAVIAQRRGWSPSLRTSLAVGVAFRLVVLAAAALSTWQPVDFIEGFKVAGEATLAGQDPVLASNGSWHFLPMVPYFYAIALATGLPWVVAGRLCTVIADLVLIVLIGKLAGPRREAQARFFYACSPLALMVSVLHGQLESIALAFLLGSYLCARAAGAVQAAPAETAEVVAAVSAGGSPTAAEAADAGASSHDAVAVGRLGRAIAFVRLVARGDGGSGLMTRWAIAAGLLFGLALSANSWPVILLPVMLSMVPGWRRRAYGLVAAGLVPLFFLATLPLIVHSSWQNLLDVARYLGGVRPVVGEWGWTALLTGGDEALIPGYSRVGQLVLYTTLALVAWFWRRGDKIDMTSAMLLAFMVVTPRMGVQYLLWFVPFLIARPTRWSHPAMIAGALWAGVGYLYLTQFDDTGWWIRHVWWAQGSLLVIPWLALAMPWQRRGISPATTDAQPDSRDLVTAS